MLTTSIKKFVSKCYEAVSDAMEQRTGLNLRGSRAKDPRFEKERIVPEEITLADDSGIKLSSSNRSFYLNVTKPLMSRCGKVYGTVIYDLLLPEKLTNPSNNCCARHSTSSHKLPR
jgi:hypothetical protein